MNNTNRFVQEDTWWKTRLRIRYTSLLFILTALAVSYLENNIWLVVPLIGLGITMIGLDVRKYQTHRTHVNERHEVRSLRWDFVYDLVDSAILILITGVLLFMKIDTLTMFVALTLWVVFGQTLQKQFGERMSSVEPFEKQRLKR
ncbi:hypothetical protein [Exiguobacterium qingdaonense]|uniref:hypothetical protein n=1 Tax=Exiguobacterium qingdaonense TaxID=2751251 RepID=UPI001BE673F2|nr:hypothetical protein [Exiguobacterium qingdaonense]